MARVGSLVVPVGVQVLLACRQVKPKEQVPSQAALLQALVALAAADRENHVLG